MKPPSSLQRLLARLLPREAESRSILGDLAEDHATLAARRGRAVAGLWYLRETVRLGTGYAARRLRAGAGNSLGAASRLLAISARRLLQDRLFSSTAVLITALGLATSSTAFGLSRMMSSGALGVPDAERLVIPSLERDGRGLPVGYADWQDWRDHVSAFDRVAISTGTSANLGLDDGTLRVTLQVGTSEYLELLGAVVSAGRLLTADDDRQGGDVAILGRGFWTRQFGGDPAVVGTTIRLDGVPVRVVGVLAAAYPLGGGDAPDVHLPISAWSRSDPSGPDGLQNRGARRFGALARLAPGVTLADARAELARVSQSLDAEFPASNRGVRVDLTPVREAVTGGLETPVAVMQLASLLLLLVGTLNVVALMLVRLSGRAHDQAVELALGARRVVVFAGPAFEAGWIGVAGIAAGAVGHWWLVSAVNASSLIAIPPILRFGPDPTSVLIISAGLFSVLVAAGILGARLVGPRGHLSSWLSGTRGSVGNRRTVLARRGLVAAEVAATTCLLIAALVLGRSFSALRGIDAGYQTDGRLVVFAELPASTYATPDQMRRFGDDALDRLTAQGGIASAAIWSRRLPGQATSFTTIVRRDKPVSSQGDALIGRQHFVTAGALRDIGLQLRRGDWLSDDAARAGRREVIISESLATDLWPEGDALGQTLRRFIPPGAPADAEEDWAEVVGVVADARFSGRVNDEGTLAATSFDVYFSWTHSPQRQVVFLLSSPQPESVTVSDVRRTLAGADPDVAVFDFQALGDTLAGEEDVPRMQATMMGAYSGVVLALSAVGLFGLLLSSVRERSRELCLRSLLGCTRAGIVRLVLVEGLLVSGVGAIGGLALAFGLTGLLSSQLFGVTPRDPVSFTVAPIVVLAVAMLASYLPARTGSRQDLRRLLRG